MKNGDISNKIAPIVAIDFDTIFSRKPSTKEKLLELATRDYLKYRFDKRFFSLTRKLFNAGYNVHIVSLKKIAQYEDELINKYILFNNIYTVDNLRELYFNCNNIYTYYIDNGHNVEFLSNKYTYEDFMELI